MKTRSKNVPISRTLEKRETTSLKDVNGFYAYVARTSQSRRSTATYEPTVDTGTTYTPLRGAYLERKRPFIQRWFRMATGYMERF